MTSVNTDNYQATPLATIKDDFALVKYDPTLLIKRSIETMEAVTNNESLILDPTHPAVMFMEMSAVMAATNLQETIGLLRSEYPELAESEDQLYRHMSDDDYLNRFASASSTKITFGMLMNDVLTKMAYDSSDNTHKLVIPRDSRFTVDGVTFTLLYPVVIRKYATGALQIAYDASIDSPLKQLSGLVISPYIRRSPKQDEWIFFDADVLQVDYATITFPIERTYNFKKTIQFIDSFYYARAFYRNGNTNQQWVEMKTTHTDQVFDSNIPTVLLRVLDSTLEVRIPIVYFSKNMLSGELRIDVYSTKGALTMDLKKYAPADFVADLTPIDRTRDITPFTLGMADISYYVFGRATTAGGKEEITYPELRSRVIDNAIGPIKYPITSVQTTASAANNGFEIVRHIDVVTNRVFLATRKLPKPSNEKLITPANIGMITFMELLSTILVNEKVVTHNKRYTLLSKALFRNQNGKVTMLRKSDEEGIRAMGLTNMVAHINSNEYFYTPFYYVLDETAKEFDLRAYHLDQPYAVDQSFERQNQTVQLFVNTNGYSFAKTAGGYRLTIQTNSGSYYKEATDAEVGVQLAFYPYGQTTLAYINGVQIGKTQTGERIFQFDILTDHDVDSNNLIGITNARVDGITNFTAWLALELRVNIIHYTSFLPSGYVADETDGILGKFILPDGVAGNSLEQLTLHLGDTLTNLWRRNHSYSLDTFYQTHPMDVPAFYEEDVFDYDASGRVFDIVNNEIVYRIKHHKGDFVLNDDGSPVYRFKKGDAILDEQGQPVKRIELSTGREMDLLVVDARYYFSTDTATVAYCDEVAATLASWITTDVEAIKNTLLEKTVIFYYPKTTLGAIEVNTENGETDFITAEQTFSVKLYVKKAIYGDEAIRTTLQNATISMLDTIISQNEVNMTEARNKLKEMYGDSVVAFKIAGLGAENDYEIVSMVSEKSKLCLRKELRIQPDMSTYVQDAIDFEFKLSK